MKNILKQESGFSLVQVMVAFGLMGVLSVMMMKMSENQSKQQKTFELKAETGDLQALIRQTLFDKEACEATFIGMSPGDDINSIRMTSDMSQPPFAEVGVKFKSYNVFIKSMYLLTRQEEVDLKQRDPASKPISNYTTGAGFGYLRVTFTKQPGAITDSNKTHNFYGSKDSAIIFPIKGAFYDMEIVRSNFEEQLDDACYSKAAAKGLTCNGGANQPCSVEIIDEDHDGKADTVSDLDGTPLYLAECRYYRDDSPFMECAN